MIRQAVILVGGLGTRLGGLTADMPKPLLPVGGRPFLAWVLDALARTQVEDVLLLAGFRADRIEAALPELSCSPPLRLHVVAETEPAGTGGALFRARHRLAARFAVLNGDSLFDVPLAPFLAQAAADPSGVLGRMLLRRMDDASRYGVALLEGERIVGFRDRPQSEREDAGAGGGGGGGLINAGIAVLAREPVDSLAPVASLERDCYPRLAAAGALRGTVADGWFIDIGIPSALAEADRVLRSRG